MTLAHALHKGIGERHVGASDKEEHMLHLITDAPEFVVRELLAFARGWVEQSMETDPAWVESIVHVHEDDASIVLGQLKRFRWEARRPARVAYGDPTFALAAASIERGESGTPSAASYAR